MSSTGTPRVLGALALAMLVSIASAEDWRELGRRDGVVVEMRRDPAGAVTVRGTGTLVRSIEAVRGALLDLERFAGWIQGLAVWRVLARGEREAVVYGRHRLPWPLSDRDYVVRYAWESSADRFRLESRSIESRGSERAPVPGVVRLGAVHSLWEVRALAPDRSEVSYTYDGDLGGSLPGFVREAAWQREAPALLRALDQEIERRSR